MFIDISKLPEWVKLEITKKDLISFAKELKDLEEGDSIESIPAGEEDLLNFKDMCDFLGIAKSTGYQRISRGEIPHFKKGRRLYFRKSELIEWVESGRRKTKRDLEELADNYLKSYKKRKTKV